MFQDSDGFKKLVETYTAKDAEKPIGLYLGAGVNLPTRKVEKKYFDTYSWGELLRAVYVRNLDKYDKSFERMKAESSGDWAKLASALVGRMSVEELVDQLDQLFYHGMPREDKDGRLSKRMLAQAPTLHAAICFTARINEKHSRSWTFIPNPRVGTVVTPNYDFFFGAGWTRYQNFSEHWKVETRLSVARTETPSAQRKIKYIHGYLPYRLKEKEDLVLTHESYTLAYQRDEYARKTFMVAVRDYRLIFIGTSLSDRPVCRILSKAEEKGGKQHFVIDAVAKPERLREFDEMGLIPVIVQDYSEIADVLEQVYCAGLESEDWQKFGFTSAHDYWERLKLGPNE